MERASASHPAPACGRLAGGTDVLTDVTGQHQSETDSVWLAAIVDSSDDAIISKSFEGGIMSRNVGAKRMLGASQSGARRAADRAGKPVTAALSKMCSHLGDNLRGGARIRAVEFIDVSAEGESHERYYEGPAFHASKHAIDNSKTGKKNRSKANYCATHNGFTDAGGHSGSRA